MKGKNSPVVENLLDADVLELSKRFTSVANVKVLEIQGLKMPGYAVDTHINQFPNDPSSAAHSLLKKWVKGQQDPETARINIKRALEETGNNFFLSLISKYESTV